MVLHNTRFKFDCFGTSSLVCLKLIKSQNVQLNKKYKKHC